MRVDAKNKRRSAVLHKKRLNKQFFDKILLKSTEQLKMSYL